MENTTECKEMNHRPSCGYGLVVVVVLYILLAIILSSIRAC